MSDAVNCLVYVSSPIDVDPVKEAEGVLREIEESGMIQKFSPVVQKQ